MTESTRVLFFILPPTNFRLHYQFITHNNAHLSSTAVEGKAKMDRCTEGLATGVAFELPQKIMQELLYDFMLVSEEEIMHAMEWLLERAYALAEGAGATSLAAAYHMRDKLNGKKVGLICSGGNTSLEHLKRVLALWVYELVVGNQAAYSSSQKES